MDGDLLWYRHDGRADGTVPLGGRRGQKVGTGWIFEHVFAGPGGVIYAITHEGVSCGTATTDARTAASAGRPIPG